LIHDSPIQVTLPGENVMSMYEYNEIFNTGYGEGDGGAMYMRVTTCIETPALHDLPMFVD